MDCLKNPRATLLILIVARLPLDDQIAKLDAVVMRLLRSTMRSA